MDKKKDQSLMYSFFSKTKNHTTLFRFESIFINKTLLLLFIIFVFGLFSFVCIRVFNKTENSAVSSLRKIEGKPVFAEVNAIDVNVNKTMDNKIVSREVIGFLPSWTAAQNVNVDTKILTQVIYFGLGVNDNGEIIKYNKENNPTFEWLYFTSDYFMNIRREAKENNAKVLISFKMFDNESIDNLISNSASADFFIKNAISIVNEYDLDGINLDFEYFTDSDFPTSRYLNNFLEKLSSALKEENGENILSVDVNATVIISDKAYDMIKIGELADQVIVMAYDYRNINSLSAGPVSPLHGEINEHSIGKSVDSLIGKVSLNKIILAVPFYGYEWETLNKKNKSAVIPNSGALATYKRVMELLSNRKDVEKYWDSKSFSSWLVYDQNGVIKQIYYEDEQSIAAKMEFIKNKNLGGIAIWALGYEGKYSDIWNSIASKK